MKKMKFKIIHLMIQEYDNALSRNKNIYRKKFYEALEFHHQNQRRELLEQTSIKESYLVKDESILTGKEFETLS